MATIDVAPERSRPHPGRPGRRDRAPLAGVAFTLLLIAAFVVGGSSPEGDDSAAKITSFYNDHMTTTIVSCVLAVLAAPFAVYFGAAVRQVLRREDAAARRWSDATLAAAGVLAAALLVTATLGFALADGADNNIPPVAMQAINVISADSWLMFVPAIGTLGIAIGAGILTTRVVARWAGWVALILGVACFIPFVSFFAFVLSAVWVPLVSIKLSSAEA